MQAKFVSLSVVLSALFISQLVGAVPKIDCSLVRCAVVKCPLGQTSQIKPGTCCPTCRPCDCSAVQCLACPDNTVAITVPGQCCPTCKPKPDCTNVLCLECVGEIEAGNCCPTCELASSI
ncbi:hypothetical protein B0H17DRAFT_503408 [Mycena rosella]|uniref:Uncharacterized protein n=1 Tax=Mycena rosella TaxID=1033263 RepID=A0AAD7C0S5_MYCRO|nr:hypothetical protein B0H17DRAFT_503408 [Mycena rosella]